MSGIRRVSTKTASRIAGVAIALVGLSGASLVTAAPAQALDCLTQTRWTFTYVHPNDPNGFYGWNIDGNSECENFYAAKVKTRNDKVRGWYFTKSTSKWTYGTRGWVAVTTTDTWRTLLSAIKDGTRVDAQTFSYAQDVVYVW